MEINKIIVSHHSQSSHCSFYYYYFWGPFGLTLKAGWLHQNVWKLQWRSPSLWLAVLRGTEVSPWGRCVGWMSRTRPCWATSPAKETVWVDSSTLSSPPPPKTPRLSLFAGWDSVTKAATSASLICIRPVQSRDRPASLLPVSKAILDSCSDFTISDYSFSKE